MLLYTTLSCTSYFVIIGDLALGIFGYFFPSVELLQSRAVVVPLVCVVFIFPLCMMKSVLFRGLLTSSGGLSSLRVRGVRPGDGRCGGGHYPAVHQLPPRQRDRGDHALDDELHPHGAGGVRVLQLPLQRSALLQGAQEPQHASHVDRRAVLHSHRVFALPGGSCDNSQF